MRVRWIRAVVAMVLVLSPLIAIVASHGPVAAQERVGRGGLTLPVYGPIRGGADEEGTFQGTVSELEFSGDGALLMGGLLNGIVDLGERTVRIVDQELRIPVEPSVADATDAEGEATSATGAVRFFQDTEPDPGKCDILYLDIQPITLNLLGLEVLTSRITLDANAIPGEGNLVGNLLCALSGLLDGLPGTLDQVTDQLNQIVTDAGAALDEAQRDAQGLGSVPLFGTFEENGETGTFQGTVSDLVFSEDGGTVVDGVLNGITNVGDETTRVVDQPITSPVTPSVVGSVPADQAGNNNGNQNDQPTTEPSDSDNPTQPEPDPDKCDVLYLDIQPITLNLLGLEVLTSRITVDVNAIPGEGNLAGNLVCALAGLLDGTPDAIGQITDQLNQIVQEAGLAPATAADADGTPGTEPTTAAGVAEATEAPDTGGTDAGTGAEPTVEPTAPAEPTAEPTTAPTEAPEPTAAPTEPAEPTVAPEPTESAEETPSA
jgi:hypothetical protein